MRLQLLLVPTLLVALPLTASAQFGRPTITLSPGLKEVNIGQTELAEDAPIARTWIVTLPDLTQTYNFAITYDTPDRTATTSQSLVELDSGSNEGTAISGRELTFSMKPSQILKGLDTSATPTGTRKIVIHVYRSGDRDNSDSDATTEVEFDYDLDAPPPPTIKAILPGENRMHVEWDAPSNAESDVEDYQILFHPNVGTVCASATVSTTFADLGLPSTITSTSFAMAAQFPESDKQIPKTQTSFSINKNLQNGACVLLVMRSTDESGNASELSRQYAIGKPVPVFDFYEYHRALGGGEDGGFCFVATAAHASYAHPTVQVLRWFRDDVMKRSIIGTSLVGLYYRLSPPLAEHVRHDEGAASVVRLALIPIALLALLWLAAPVAGFGVLVYMFRRTRIRKTAFIAPALIALALAPIDADAQMKKVKRSDMGWALTFEGGPYLPAMGGVEKVGGKEVAKDAAFFNVFGDSANALYTLGLDVHLYRGFGGSMGIGGSFGFMQFVGRGLVNAVAAPTSSDVSNDTTVFNILPLYAELFYRLEYLDEKLGVPLLPYIRGGIAYYVWWVTNGVGDVSRVGSDKGLGGKFGLTGTLGLALLLDSLEPRAAHRLEATTGISGTSLYGEVQASKVDSFSADGFDLSDLTWNLGVYLEF